MPNAADPILKRQITPKMCAEVVRYLRRTRRWSFTGIAKTVNASPEFVRRVAAAQQCFEYADLESLGKAVGLTPHVLVFDSMQRDQLPADLRGLYDMTRELIESGKEFQRVMRRKSSRVRRAPTKAA